MKVKEGCGSCGATGIYRGFAEPPGVGVICGHCGGVGFNEKDASAVAPKNIVEGRKRCDDVRRVHWSRGAAFATGVGPTRHSVSYEEFLAGKLPRRESEGY